MLSALVFGCACAALLWQTVRSPVEESQPGPWLRRTLGAGLVGMGLLSLRDVAVFYWLLARGRIVSGFPLPLSLFVAGLAVTMAVSICKGVSLRRRACWLKISSFVLGGSIGVPLLVLIHLLTFGSTNYARCADVAIILGAKVYSDGTPSTSLADRLRTGVELYQQGRVQYLLMTGGTGREGCNEAHAMRDYAVAAGVPEQRILIDERGVNTRASARNCRPILNEHGLASALIVSHYYHLARCKMVFAEQGIYCTTVPARMSMRLVKEPYYVVRECVAYLAYAVERPFRPIAAVDNG